MGIFDRLFKREERAEEDNTAELLEPFLYKREVTTDQLNRMPAVVSSVEQIASMVAMLPIKLYKKEKREDGSILLNEIVDDYRLNLLNNNSGDIMSPFEIKKALIRNYFLSKGGYVYIERRRNKIISLRYVDPMYIGFTINNDPIYKDGRLKIRGKSYEKYDFITILRNSNNGLFGTPITEELRDILETAYKTYDFEKELVSKGGAKKGFIRSTQRISAEGMEYLKKAFKNFYKNNDNLMVLNNGLEFQDAGSSSVELQLEGRKKMLNSEIKEAFNLDGDIDDIIKKAIMPVISILENAINESMLLEKEKESYYFAFDTIKLTRGNTKERFEAYKIALDGGWLTTNEVRALEDYKSVEGLDLINMSLGGVYYDTKSAKYYTPNTNQLIDMKGGIPNKDRKEE